MIIKSPEVYIQKIMDYTPSVFLAGGITGCPDWQDKAGTVLSRRYVVLNPRREGMFDTIQPEWGVEQIEWEHQHLEMADLILFWFPKEGMCAITLFELGKCLASNRKVIIGCDPEYIRAFDVYHQTRLINPNLTIHTTLDDLISTVMNYDFSCN